MAQVILIISSLLLMFLAWRLWRSPSRRWLNRLTACGLMLLVMPITGMNTYQHALTYRPQPDTITAEVLFDGITYTQDVRTEPRPLVIHIVEIDLTNPNIQLTVTPPDDGLAFPYEVQARTTSEYLQESGVQLAINAGFFSAEGTWFSPLPASGDPVDIVGIAAHEGDIYSDQRRGFRGVYFAADNTVSIDTVPNNGIYNAIAGYYWFLRDGIPWTPRYRAGASLYYQIEPRTVVATNQTGDKLLFFIVDGRQSDYSEGVSIEEMTAIVQAYGGYNALNLDGGGSSTLVINDDGTPDVLNSPVHRRIPGLERPVGNHIGVFAAPATEPLAALE